MTKQESHCFSCGSIKQVNNAKKAGKNVTFPRTTWHLHVTVTFKRHI